MPRAGQVRTGRKQIWLTDETRGAVQEWADAQGISFSAALESLARLGLGQQPELALAPALVSLVRRELQQQAHRLASLYASTAIEAGVTARLVGATLRTLREADYEQIKRAARIDAVAALRRRSALLELTADTVPATDGAVAAKEGGDGHR